MPDIIVTYTSEDAAFAKKIVQEISEEGFNVKTSENESLSYLKDKIQHAHYFIPVYSVDFWSDSNLIEQCKFALDLNKSVLPLQRSLYDDLDWNIIPPQISKLRWYNFLEEDLYEESSTNLITFILKNHHYLKTHTYYLNAAILWEQFGYQTRHLLSHTELKKAVDWLVTQKNKYTDLPTEPTELHCAFISESRRNIENETADIFILHSDKNEVEQELLYTLQRKGVSCTSRSMPYNKTISTDKAIENTTICILLSTDSQEAKEVAESELRYAETLNKPILNYQVKQGEYDTDYPEIEIENIKNGLLPGFDEDTSQYLRFYTKIFQRARVWQGNGQSKQSLLYGHDLSLASKWYTEGGSRNNFHPLGVHEEYIEESTTHAHNLSPEVFMANAASDLLFAKNLNARLQKTGKVTYWPFEHLTFDENQEEIIYHGISSSDLFVIILSTYTIKRGVYKEEVLYAQRLHKKIIGVLIEEIDEADFPKYLKGINICPFIEEERTFDESLGDLLSRLESHQVYEREFNKVNQWTKGWLKYDKSTDFLIPENEIDGVEKWYHTAIAANRVPAPTFIHQEYIEESRQHASKIAREEHKKLTRFRIALAVAAGMLVISLGLLFNMVRQNNQIQELLTETESTKLQAQEQKALLAIQLQENRLLVDSLRGIDQFARLKEYQRDSMIQKYMAVRNNQIDLEEKNDVLAQENSYYKGDIEIIDFMKDLREKYKQDGTDQTLFSAYYDVVMSRRLNPGHKAPIYHIVSTPDAKFILTAGGDGNARLLNIGQNRVKTFLQNRYNGAVNSAAFSKDGKQILTASHDGSAILWDVASGKPVTKFQCGGDVKYASFAPNRKWIVTTEKEGEVSVWDMRSAKSLAILKHEKDVNMAVFSEDSKYVFSAGQDGKLRKWNLKDGSEEVTATFPTSISSVVLAPNGKELLITSGSKALRVNLRGQTLVQFRGHSGTVIFANYSPNGQRIATSSADRTARVWDKNGNLLCVLGRNREHLGAITAASFSGDGEKVFTSSVDHTVRMWLLSPKEVFEGDNLEKYLEIGAQ